VVERGSTHHSGRVDDELAHEVEPLVRSGHEARASDDRLHEPPADDEPTPDARIAGDEQPVGVLDLDEIEARSRLATSLRPSAFPATAAELTEVALEQHAPPDVLDALGTLPTTIRFVNVQQVWEALGGEREHRDTGGVATETIDESDITVEDVGTEPLDAEIAIELELDAEDERTAAIAGAPAPTASATTPPAPSGTTTTTTATAGGEPWWMGAARTGVGIATLPLRATVGVLRYAAQRLRR
jgi:hypothetical protein